MSEQRDEYASQMPLEIRLAVDGLSGHNNTGYAVVMLLSEESQLRFEELREELNVHRQTLTNTLDDLQHGGLVKKRAGERIGDQSTGAYELSDFGDRLLNGLYQSSQPPKRLEPTAIPEQYKDMSVSELPEDGWTISSPKRTQLKMPDQATERSGGNQELEAPTKENIETPKQKSEPLSSSLDSSVEAGHSGPSPPEVERSK
jgi:DNA-binding HxlR family transcriptional regulator